jgi:rhodanese-related sulfurtransferase
MSNDNNKIAGTYEVSPAAGYAGDVAPATAWKILSERKDAVLVDVRTRAEWNYVGLPDLEKLAKKPALLEWQVFPSMQPNPEFVAALERALRQGDTAAVPLSEWSSIGRGGESHDRGRLQYMFQCSGWI